MSNMRSNMWNTTEGAKVMASLLSLPNAEKRVARLFEVLNTHYIMSDLDKLVSSFKDDLTDYVIEKKDPALLFRSLEPLDSLGMFFWTPRGMAQPELGAGCLLRLKNALVKMDKPA